MTIGDPVCRQCGAVLSSFSPECGRCAAFNRARTGMFEMHAGLFRNLAETDDEYTERRKAEQHAAGCPCYDDKSLAGFEARDDCPVHGSPLSCAAGPWIRVDSGERPEPGEEVLVAYDGHFQFLAWVKVDKWFDRCGDRMNPPIYWARIRPPEDP